MTAWSCWPRYRDTSNVPEPDPRAGNGALLRGCLLSLSLLLAGMGVAMAQGGAAGTALPIELDAEYSELDRRNDRLIFRGLRISQGGLSIAADHAEASPADFENSTWIFRGNVVMRNPEAQVNADRAEMRFTAQRLQLIRLDGSPARFEQQSTREGLPTAGRAGTMDYDIVSGVIRMSGDAWLSDGNSEISGARITYDLPNELVTADADESGQVRLRITPPEPAEEQETP